MRTVTEYARKLFDTSDFPARWHCGNWSDLHGWVHILADIAIFGAYAAIPLSIAIFAQTKRQEIAFPKLYWLFAAFILSCGLTHLVDATLFWQPWYRFSAVMKTGTAVVSWLTVIALIQLLPSAMALPGIARVNGLLRKEVSDRKASEQALLKSSARLALAMEHSHLGDWSWDAAKNLCTFSRRAAEILGVSADEAYSREAMRIYIHPEDRDPTRAKLEAALASRENYAAEYRVIRPSDGKVAWVSAKGRGIYGEDGTVTTVIGTLADVTEKKSADVERERLLANESQARAEAERANHIKDEFLATLSHELRTPLNAILGWASLLHSDPGNVAEVKAGLEVIERNTRLQANLIGDLLDMSRIVSGKIRMEATPVDLVRVVGDTIDTMRVVADEKLVTLVPPSVTSPVMVMGDNARLQQVVWNLLTNAVKFTPSGGRVEVALSGSSNRAEIVITDTGIGISPAFLPFVFERFRQEDASTTRSSGGLGLGLSIVKALVELHGGTVQAQSAGEGQGAKFRVHLPLAPRPESAPEMELFAAVKPVAPEQANLAGANILVVDDAPDNLALMARILKQHGAAVVTATSAAEALELFLAGGIHVLVSDIGMPEMDGYDLIQAIRELKGVQGGAVPAIAMTAFASQEDRDRALSAGFDFHLAKPVDPAQMLAAVCRCTGQGPHTAICDLGGAGNPPLTGQPPLAEDSAPLPSS
jgi:hypothetical protein